MHSDHSGHPNNRAVRLSASGVWGENILPVTEWENASERVVLPMDLQDALGLPDPVLRWPATKRMEVNKDHGEIRSLELTISQLLGRWEFAGREPTDRSRHSNTWNIFTRDADENVLMAVVTDREVRVNSERKPIMYTIYGPRPDQLAKRVQAGNRLGMWILRVRKE